MPESSGRPCAERQQGGGGGEPLHREGGHKSHSRGIWLE